MSKKISANSTTQIKEKQTKKTTKKATKKENGFSVLFYFYKY